MEDYIFKTSFKMTYEEYKKLYGASFRKHWKLYALCMLIPLLASLMDLIEGKSISVLLTGYLVFFVIFFIVWIGFRPIMYKRNKHLNGFETTTYFFDDRFETDTPIAHIKLNYSDLNCVIETKTNFYLYITQRQLLIVSKDNCSAENITFIQKVAESVNKNKKAFF